MGIRNDLTKLTLFIGVVLEANSADAGVIGLKPYYSSAAQKIQKVVKERYSMRVDGIDFKIIWIWRSVYNPAHCDVTTNVCPAYQLDTSFSGRFAAPDGFCGNLGGLIQPPDAGALPGTGLAM